MLPQQCIRAAFTVVFCKQDSCSWASPFSKEITCSNLFMVSCSPNPLQGGTPRRSIHSANDCDSSSVRRPVRLNKELLQFSCSVGYHSINSNLSQNQTPSIELKESTQHYPASHRLFARPFSQKLTTPGDSFSGLVLGVLVSWWLWACWAF